MPPDLPAGLREPRRVRLHRLRPASAVASGHFGELLQGRLGPSGPLALVTLPAPPLLVSAQVLPGPFGFLQAGRERPLDRGVIVAIFREVAGAPPCGRLILRSGMPAGGGAGSSTAAILATAAACAAAHGRPPVRPERLARLCLALEGAIDPLMHFHPGRLLWAPRAARILARLPALPAFDVVGGFLGPGIRTDPADLDFADIADLVAAWGPAAARGDLAALAALSTESARRNTARRGGPDLAPLVAAGQRLGALGLVAAHTGSARGLIFAPGRVPAGAIGALRELGLRAVDHFPLGRSLSTR